MSTNWQVHVIGPDDLMPAKDMLQAMKMAAAINRDALTNRLNGFTEHTPYLWAVPVPPGNTAALVAKQ